MCESAQACQHMRYGSNPPGYWPRAWSYRRVQPKRISVHAPFRPRSRKRRIAQNTLLDRSEGMLDQRAAPLHHPLSYSTSMLHRHSRSSFREERNLVQIPIQVEVELEQIGRIDGRTRPLPAGLDLPNPSRRMSSPPTHRSITRTMCSAVSVL